MRRADDVFFFTLIDFLVQVFFFGLLLYVLSEATRAAVDEQRDAEVAEIQDLKGEVEKLKNATGVSDLTELTDELTRLVPLKELKGMSNFMRDAGALENAKEAVQVVSDAGGANEVRDRLAKLQKLEQGTGKPPCIYDIVDGRRVPRSVAQVQVSDTHVIFRASIPEFRDVLSKIGASYEEVQELSLGDFRRRFAPLRHSECQHRLDVNVSTQLLAPMDAVWSAFYTRRL